MSFIIRLLDMEKLTKSYYESKLMYWLCWIVHCQVTSYWIYKEKGWGKMRENEVKLSLLDVYFLKQAAAVFIG